MKLTQFFRHLDAHGADLSRWPAGTRIAAERLIAANPDARAAHAQARSFDARLRQHLRKRADPRASAARVLARLDNPLPPQRRPLVPIWWPAALLGSDFAPAWSGCAALAAVALLGFVVGLSGAGSALTPGPYQTVRSASAGTDSDLSMIVFEPDPLSALRP
jgi:anti-sigma factor RsiW